MSTEAKDAHLTTALSTSKLLNDPFQTLLIEFKIRRLQYGDKTVFQGSVRKGATKVGQFTGGVDRREQVMFIQELFVEQGYRGNGIGEKALAFLEAEAVRLKLCKVIVDPCPLDPRALDEGALKKWYMKNGYTPNVRGLFSPRTSLLVKTLR
ncbi:MAG: GNAT family N-acetyltransferase [Nitrososphaeria archaeon]|jgi:GNAT superfamily N-acetyltransferase